MFKEQTPEKRRRAVLLAAVAAASGVLALKSDSRIMTPEASPTDLVYHVGDIINITPTLPVTVLGNEIIMDEASASAYGSAHQRESIKISLQTPGIKDKGNYINITEGGSVSGGALSNGFEQRALPIDSLPNSTPRKVRLRIVEVENIWNGHSFDPKKLRDATYTINPSQAH